MTEHLPKTLSRLLALPPPADSYLKKSRYNTIRHATEEFLRSWKQMPQEYDEFCKCSESYKCPSCGAEHELSGRDLWCRKFFIVGTYYDFLVRQLISKGNRSKKQDLAPGLNLSAYSQFLKKFPQKAQSPDPPVGHMIIAEYLSCLMPTFFTGLFRDMPYISNFPMSVFEEQSHNSMYSLHKYSLSASHPDLRRCAHKLAHGLLDLLKNVYSSERIVWNKDHRSGPFSALLTHELALLASRDKKLLSRYGAKQVEKVFEKQLALLFQSYGFYVVATKVGQKTVDLICISSDPRQKMTILVEAKTSGKPYSLPTKDRRALVEYAKDVKKSLTGMPNLEFVLITGPQPGSTLEGRLSKLEAEIQTPARYITAAELAAVRECMPGPLPMEALRNDVILSGTRILKNLDKSILKTHQSQQQAYSQFVSAMLGGVHDGISCQCKKEEPEACESSRRKPTRN